MATRVEVFIHQAKTNHKIYNRKRLLFNKHEISVKSFVWSIELEDGTQWTGAMEYDNTCGYFTKKIYNLRQNTDYKWKISLRNSCFFAISSFKTNFFGATRLILVPDLLKPEVKYDHKVIDWCMNPSLDFGLKYKPYQIDDSPSTIFDPKTINGHNVFVHLFEWKWSDVAAECERFLAPKGYGAIQISPPNEHALFEQHPWWQRYQPVSYKLDSRSGTEQEFICMINKCNALGVRVYVDAVINHMSSSEGYGSAGTYFNSKTLEYPGVPFKSSDFNDWFAYSPSGNIETYFDVAQVRNCCLCGLPDLATSKDKVRQILIDYLNRLIDIGVAGFRIDASKHMWPEDIKCIVDGLNDLRHDIFGRNKRPFIYQEVIDLGNEPIDYHEYLPSGRVTEFRYGMQLSDVIEKRHGQKLCYLRNFGSEWNFLRGEEAVAFVDNHDNQRGHGGGGQILNFFSTRQYKIANAFMLAWPYGCVQVMSSYSYLKDNHDEGPPSNIQGLTQDVHIDDNGACTNGWMCEHRWRQIVNMVKFRNVSEHAPVKHWWDNSSNQIAFSRAGKSFIAINNDDFDMSVTLQTGLPPGIYGDVISSDEDSDYKNGRLIRVHHDGTAHIHVPANMEDPVVAFHLKSKILSTCA